MVIRASLNNMDSKAICLVTNWSDLLQVLIICKLWGIVVPVSMCECIQLYQLDFVVMLFFLPPFAFYLNFYSIVF